MKGRSPFMCLRKRGSLHTHWTNSVTVPGMGTSGTLSIETVLVSRGRKRFTPKRITDVLLLLPNSSPSLSLDPKLNPVVTATVSDQQKTGYVFPGIEALISPFHPRV